MFSTETLIFLLSYLNLLKSFTISWIFQIEYQLDRKWQIVVTVNLKQNNLILKLLKLVTVVSLFKFNSKPNKMKKILF
jgi:hypothetical protein